MTIAEPFAMQPGAGPGATASLTRACASHSHCLVHHAEAECPICAIVADRAALADRLLVLTKQYYRLLEQTARAEKELSVWKALVQPADEEAQRLRALLSRATGGQKQ